MTYKQAATAARSTDCALFNQRPPSQPKPVLPTCDACQLSGPATYQKAMCSQYHADWFHVMEREISGVEGAGTLGDT